MGSIPACAGEPGACPCRSRRARVYPRVCGGTFEFTAGNPFAEGLSPRVRGNHVGELLDLHAAGSIPACAGEPAHHGRGLLQHRVYPRVCGGTSWAGLPDLMDRGLSPRVRGNFKLSNLASSVTGLSPRVRGNRPANSINLGRLRSIPACAGEPVLGGVISRPARVYPRVCGGTAASRLRPSRIGGLSPRVRGNHIIRVLVYGEVGSIPACAGEPRSAGGISARAKVYPRVCGGTNATEGSTWCVWGLSPRVRGNLCNASRTRQNIGSIPACAGEPRPCPPQRIGRWVYPRVCGETSMEGFSVGLATGLSPRVRGNHGGSPP